MSVIDLHSLVGKLEPSLSAALEAGAALAVRHSHHGVEPEHWLLAALDRPEIAALAKESGVDPDAARGELRTALEGMARGARGAPSMAQGVIGMAREAWIAASLRFGHAAVTPAVLLLTAASDPELRAVLRRAAPSLMRLNLAALEARAQEAAPRAAATATVAPAGGEDFLGHYATDLTEEARAGRIDAIVGRDAEMRQMVDILTRRRQNNPILVGEAGVGKTAVVEAFALAIAEGRVPERLRAVSLRALDLSLLQAGAGVKGEFERRLKGVVDQVRASEAPVVLFVDEAHTLMGAGGQAGQGDAANILKPALARGELRTIAATTWGEYKRHVEKDPALTRRFQVVKVDEPDIERAVRMIRAVAPRFAEHHGVAVRDGAVRAAVELSARYLPERQLPDKAVSLIDTAAAAVAMSRETLPASLEALDAEAADLRREIEALGLEPAAPGLPARLRELRRDLAAAEAGAETIRRRLEAQTALAEAADAVEAEGGEDAMERLAAAEARLSKAAGEEPLVFRAVDGEAVAGVVARWTGVPVGRLLRDQIEAVTTLEERIRSRVIGQDAAVAALAEGVRVARAGLRDPRRPQAVFLMVGASGVGKTETALALADELYGGPAGLTTINMSEFKEEHKVSLLMGSPPGYVGYGEGGVLTEAVRRRPHGVLLLDEIDKAHPGVQEIFYQVFDKGTLRDGEGRDVDFRQTVIVMTANTGSETLTGLAEDPEAMPEGAALAAMLLPELSAAFKPAFVGRTTVLPFLPLGHEILAGIVDLQMARVAERVRESYGATLTLTDAAREALASRAEAGETGARAIEAMISREVLPRLASLFLRALGRGRTPRAVEVDAAAEGFTVAPRAPRRKAG
jgi:type VI secretion system protein VasG